MIFSQELRGDVLAGEITVSFRLWKRPKVFDSEPLRRLAELQPREARAGRERILERMRTVEASLVLMPEALRSIGFDPAVADEEFTGRCQEALDVVQRDLDATGYGRYQMRATLGQGWPAMVFPALPDGSYWGGNPGLTRGMDGAGLLFKAAGSVSGTLQEGSRRTERERAAAGGSWG